MKYLIRTIILLCIIGNANGQTEFDKKVSELFFNLPMYGGFFEMHYAMQLDSAFIILYPPTGDHKTKGIRASFAFHPLLDFFYDTAEYSYTYYDSSRVFTMRRLSLIYDDDEEEQMHNQFQQLFDYFEPVAYMYVENPDHDKFPGKSISFYRDYNAFYSKYPKLDIHYNQIPRRNKQGSFYTFSISYIEEK